MMESVLKQLKKQVMCIENNIDYGIICDCSAYYPGFCTNCKRYDFVFPLTDCIKTCDDCLYNKYYEIAINKGIWL